jgi:hypothetical protein
MLIAVDRASGALEFSGTYGQDMFMIEVGAVA